VLSEHEYEPVPGLPERLPTGEEILWQGAPRWDALARRAFHVRKVIFYFLILLALHSVWQIQSGKAPAVALADALVLVIPAALAIGLLVLLARAIARATLYTVTNRRVVMRFGVAIEMTVNFPFATIRGAALKDYGDGTGDIPLSLEPPAKVSYPIMWPHVRPWYFAPAEPMLRTIPDAASVARILASALESDAARRAGDSATDPAHNALAGDAPAGREN
jgi:hypothetical protein